MEYKHKLILALIEIFGNKLTGTDFQKLLFLYEDYYGERYFDFIPYKFGCFSFELVHNKINLINEGYLSENNNTWALPNNKYSYFKTLTPNDKESLISFKGKFENIRGKNLLKFVYTNYPYYAIKSGILNEILNKKEIEIVNKFKRQDENSLLFTIGYEGLNIDKYIDRLIRNNIKALFDVRKNSISRKYGFSKNRLKSICDKTGIEYFHFPELGIDSTKRQSLNNQHDYEILFNEYERTTLIKEKKIIQQVSEIAKKYKRTALTCFEASHIQCHRSRLANAITKQPDWEIPLKHI